jgi:hypothetical protein
LVHKYYILFSFQCQCSSQEHIEQLRDGSPIKRICTFEEDADNKYVVMNSQGVFVGAVCPRSAGGDSRFDIFVTDPGSLNMAMHS